VVGCDTISVTYKLRREETVTIVVENSGTLNEKFLYYIEIDGLLETLSWGVSTGDISYWKFTLGAILEEDTECPYGFYTIVEGSNLQSFEVNPIL
jgi:hypothetical protein